MKRSAFLMVTVGSTIANAGPAEAVAISQVALGYAQQRIAADLGSALLLDLDEHRRHAETELQGSAQRGEPGVRARARRSRSATTLAAGDKNAVSAITARSSSRSASRNRSTPRA